MSLSEHRYLPLPNSTFSNEFGVATSFTNLRAMDKLALFDSNASVDVKGIEVSGNNRTRLAYFASELAPPINDSKNLKELYANLYKATDRILARNIFDNVSTNVEIDSLAKDRYSATIKVDVQEKGIPFVKMSSYVSQGRSSDVGFEIQGALRNPTGNGEILKLASVTSQGGLREHSLSLNYPNVGPALGTLDISAKSGQENQSYFTSYKQENNSVQVDYTSRDNRQRFSAEYSLRDEIPLMDAFAAGTSNLVVKERLEKVSSLPTLAAVASSVKTSLKYDLTLLDTRDSKPSPSCGKYLQGAVEVALPPGNATFVKADVSAQMHHSMGPSLWGQPGLTGSLSGSLGLMVPLGRVLPFGLLRNKRDQSYLSDRYHLGGPLNLRGFDVTGAGSRAFSFGRNHLPGFAGSQDSLGGDARTNLLAMLSVPVPVESLAKANVRAFAFFNAGSLGSANYWNSDRGGAQQQPPLFGHVRASVGAGLSVALADQIRLEVTYAVPVLKASQDNVKGFQIGLGMSIN